MVNLNRPDVFKYIHFLDTGRTWSIPLQTWIKQPLKKITLIDEELGAWWSCKVMHGSFFDIDKNPTIAYGDGDYYLVEHINNVHVRDVLVGLIKDW